MPLSNSPRRMVNALLVLKLMAPLPIRFSALVLAAAVQASSLLISLPAQAASALAAWKLSSSGELLLRTAAGARLQAFFEAGDRRRGPRVWIDFPGELSRSRSLPGSGPIREIRLGKPSAGETRLVIEFQPGVNLDPSQLKLIGTASNRWKLSFQGLSTTGLRPIGEGNLNRATSGSWAGGLRIQPSRTPVNAAGLPSVPRGKYRVVIDPGHGGPDPGAVGIRGIRESEIVLDISLQVGPGHHDANRGSGCGPATPSVHCQSRRCERFRQHSCQRDQHGQAGCEWNRDLLLLRPSFRPLGGPSSATNAECVP